MAKTSSTKKLTVKQTGAKQPGAKQPTAKTRQKWIDSDPTMRDLVDDFERMAWRPREPQAIGSIVSGLLARRGYGQLTAAEELETAWNELVGPALAGQTQIGKVQRGVLQVAVGSSAVLQELTFQKTRLVTELARRFPQAKIRDIRVRVTGIR